MGRLASVSIKDGYMTSLYIPVDWKHEIDVIIQTRQDIHPSRNQFMRCAIFKEIRRLQEEDKNKKIIKK